MRVLQVWLSIPQTTPPTQKLIISHGISDDCQSGQELGCNVTKIMHLCQRLRQAVYLQGVIFKISSDNVLLGIAISQLIISLLCQLSVIQIISGLCILQPGSNFWWQASSYIVQVVFTTRSCVG